MTTDRSLKMFRIVVLVYFLVAAAITLFAPVGNGVKAPLLTLMGGASIVVGMFPFERGRINYGIIIGTIIALFGSGTWFADAAQGDLLLLETPTSIIGFLFPITVIVTLAYASSSLIFSIWRAMRAKPIANPKPHDGKNSILVLGILSMLLVVLHSIRSNIDQKRRNNAIDTALLK